MIHQKLNLGCLLLFVALLLSNCSTPVHFGVSNSKNRSSKKRTTPKKKKEKEEVIVFEEVEDEIEQAEETSPKNNNAVSHREEIFQFAKQFLGTKYIYGGKTPKGFDCSGFTHYVMNNFGYKISPASKLQAKNGEKVKLKDVKAGDLVFFKKKGRVFHVALVVDNSSEGLYVIHSTNRGVVVDNISKSSYWKPQLSAARDVISKGEKS